MHMVCVCVFLYLLHSEYLYLHVSTIWLLLFGGEIKVLRLRLDLGSDRLVEMVRVKKKSSQR